MSGSVISRCWVNWWVKYTFSCVREMDKDNKQSAGGGEGEDGAVGDECNPVMLGLSN